MRKGCNVMAFTLARSSSQAKDQKLRIKKPVVTCSALSDREVNKKPGPADHFPVVPREVIRRSWKLKRWSSAPD